MSRSHRKTPIFGITTCASEREDKKAWHGRWRAQEHVRLKRDEDGHTVHPRAVSDPWAMGKDGRRYWSAGERESSIEAQVGCKGKTRREREALKARARHKWMGK